MRNNSATQLFRILLFYRGYSSVGRAQHLQCWGRRFESDYLHKNSPAKRRTIFVEINLNPLGLRPVPQGTCGLHFVPAGGSAASMLRISLTLHRAPDGASLRSESIQLVWPIPFVIPGLTRNLLSFRAKSRNLVKNCDFGYFLRYLRNAKPQSPWITRKSM